MHKHEFVISDKFAGYEFCPDCGSYHSIVQDDPKIIYEAEEYWSYDNKRSKIEEQVLNLQCIDDCGISKVDRIMQFVPDGGTVLEIGCAPGILMKKLCDKGFDTFGIEPSERYLEFICNQAPKAKVFHGYFPQVSEDFKDEILECIIGMDVMEHVDDYESFFKEVQRLLIKGGTGIIMSPIILNEDGLFRERDFSVPREHCWIHSQKFLEPYLQEMFSEVKFSRWIVGHELIILKK